MTSVRTKIALILQTQRFIITINSKSLELTFETGSCNFSEADPRLC